MKTRSFLTAILLTAACALSIQAQAQLPEKTIVIPPGTGSTTLYSPAVKFEDTLYISGTGEGQAQSPGESYESRTSRILESIRAKLDAAGLDRRHVVTTWVMFEDFSRLAEVEKAFTAFFPDNPPACTIFGAARIPGPSEVEITSIAYADLSRRKTIGASGGMFSPGVLAGKTLYISGQTGAGPDGKISNDFEEQARQAMLNAGKLLNEAGLDWRHVVWTNVYLNNDYNLGAFNKVYSGFFEYGDEPARVTVIADKFPRDIHVMIACVATTDLSIRKTVRPAVMTYGHDGTAMTASPAVWAGNTLYMSLQCGYDPTTGIAGNDLETQTRQMAANHYAVLREAGLKPSNLAWGHVWLRSIDDYRPFNGLYREYFTSPPPVRTCFQPNRGFERNNVLVKSAFIAVKSAPTEAERNPFKIGIIGLDTSHVVAFTRRINDPERNYGCRVVAAYPGGSPDVKSSYTRIDGFTKQLRDEQGVEIVDSIEELVGKVDGILLESVDGRPHLEQIRPVIAAKKPVFIDKPMAGSLEDVIEIFRLARENDAPCWSSSSLRFNPGIIGMRNNPEIGEILGCDAFSPCSLEEHHPDLYWYGVHGVEILFTIMGTGCQTVKRVQTDGFEHVVGVWEDGRIGTFRGLRKGRHDYGAFVYGTKGIRPSGGYTGYGPLVDRIITFFKTGEIPVPPEETIELFAFMTAADVSKERGGVEVKLSEVIEAARR